MIRVLDSAGSTLVEWGRQQQQQHTDMKNYYAMYIYTDICRTHIYTYLYMYI